MKILIIGEAGERPWFDGCSARHLWRWFGVSSYEELYKMARLMNVYEVKNTRIMSAEHWDDLLKAMYDLTMDLVFLVGRVAQSLIDQRFEQHDHLVWKRERYVGLPHPSGLNRQLNSLNELLLCDFVNSILTSDDALYSRTLKVLEGDT